MKNLLSLTIFSIVICFYSCKKDKKAEPVEEVQSTPAISYPNYSNLKVGNYWIYQRYEIDGSGNEVVLSVVDSCYIEKDTVINGNTYYKYMSPNYSSLGSPNTSSPVMLEFYRDSLSYLITSSGRIEFSSQDFSTIFKSGTVNSQNGDTIYKYEHKMGDKNMSITTSAGTFITSSFKEIYHMYPNYNAGGSLRVRNTRYSENIGKVTQEWYFFSASPTRWERRLIRYHLN